MAEKESLTEFPTARHSACAEAGLRAERARLAAMTVEERILEALSLYRVYQQVIGSVGVPPSGGAVKVGSASSEGKNSRTA